MSPEMYAVGVPLIGVVLLLLGVGLAIRGGTNTAPHEAKLGPFGITSPGPGIPIALLGALLLLARMVWPDVGQTSPEKDDDPPSTSPETSPTDDVDPAPTEPDPPTPEPSHTDDGTERPTHASASTHSIALGFGVVDLDRARLVDGPDLDQKGELFLSAPGQLAPLSPHRMVVGEASSLPGCVEALKAYDDPGLALDDPQHGGEFCMTTSEGAVAGVVVESWDPQNHQLQLGWTLWHP